MNAGMHRTSKSWLFPLLALMFTQRLLSPVTVSAIQLETSAEKQEHFKQQALGELFHRWTFDQQTPEDALSGFSQFVVGGDASPVWTIAPEKEAPSPPKILKAQSSCQTGSCYQLLVADKLQYEYPDVTVRLRYPEEGGVGQGGIVIGLKDEQHFYAAIVDLAAKKLQVLRVLGDQDGVGRNGCHTEPGGVAFAANESRHDHQQRRHRGIFRRATHAVRTGSNAWIG